MDTPPRNYNPLEPVIHLINRNFITISPEEKDIYSSVLESISEQITTQMKKCDRLFKSMFTSIFYGGSFYDGLKVAPPDEFDLDLLLAFPKGLNFEIADATNIPCHVRVKLLKHKPSIERLNMNKYNGLNKMINRNHYLKTSAVLSWMQGVLDKALNEFEQDSEGQYIFETALGNFYINKSASGPASTLIASGEIEGEEIQLSIDLVPCFVFGKDHWPQGSFRQNPKPKKPNFFIVPKPVKGVSNSDHFWRLSFQEQERAILFNQKALKPSIRLVKKMRDYQEHESIASYYIKTVALWMLKEQPKSFFRRSSQSHVFMTVLKKYHEFLERKKLPYYWNSNCNLLGRIDDATLINMSNKIKSIILDIERHLGDDPFVVAESLMTSQEVLQFKTEAENLTERRISF